jgi:hypothetical protein
MMKVGKITQSSLRHCASFALAAAAAGFITAGAASAADEPTVIPLTQTGCQFVESENGVDHMYTTMKAADCKAINGKTAEQRLAKAGVLKLKPGSYIFRVTNKNVPYGLGFWLRGQGLGRLTLPSVSGGGLEKGVTLDYKISLKPGNYLYSCPLNPTPDYRLVVEG